MRDYSENDELNEFIAVELAMGTGRIMTRVHDRVYIAMETKKIIARIIEKVLEMETKTARDVEKRKATISELFNHKQAVLDLYWDRKSDSEIADELQIDAEIVQSLLDTIVPRDLIYKKYNEGMLPSRIGRLSNVNLTTNCVRRVLNMEPVKEKKDAE